MGASRVGSAARAFAPAKPDEDRYAVRWPGGANRKDQQAKTRPHCACSIRRQAELRNFDGKNHDPAEGRPVDLHSIAAGSADAHVRGYAAASGRLPLPRDGDTALDPELAGRQSMAVEPKPLRAVESATADQRTPAIAWSHVPEYFPSGPGSAVLNVGRRRESSPR